MHQEAQKMSDLVKLHLLTVVFCLTRGETGSVRIQTPSDLRKIKQWKVFMYSVYVFTATLSQQPPVTRS